jgi:D-alanyl-lipoteichoic acid acyltransferase DltB (MBOAT superfamily)
MVVTPGQFFLFIVDGERWDAVRGVDRLIIREDVAMCLWHCCCPFCQERVDQRQGGPTTGLPLSFQVSIGTIFVGVTIVAIYPIYLYFNFSGYTDAAIGAARLFRIELPEHFDRPFTSENFINFWSRWHITLSAWLKAYVYIPLLIALMRRFESPRYEPYFGVFAFFVTFFLVGAWHGQTSKFLFFGVLQGAGVAVNKLYQIEMTTILGRRGYRLLCDNPLYRMLSRGLTFTWFAFRLLWFWSGAMVFQP